MPATAGRVRMPANNRVHSSAALQTHGIWQSAIGYDPYAPTNKDDKSAKPSTDGATVAGDGESSENAYASFQGLLALARITGSSTNETRGACKKCGRVGHLTFQCRNFLSAKDPDDAADKEAQANALAVFDKIKKSNKGDVSADESEEEEEDSESSDSDVDPEIEKLIAARFGNKSKKSTTGLKEIEELRSRRGRSKKRSEKRSSHKDESHTDEEGANRKEKRRRRHKDSDDEDERRHKHRKSRKDKKRRNHKRKDSSESDSYSESGSDSDRPRRRHKRAHRCRYDSDSSGESSDDPKRSHRRHENRKKRRATSDTDSKSDGMDSETSRGRNGKKRSEKKSKSSRKEEKI